MELGFRCLVWCNLQKHKEVTCGFVNLVKSDAFLTWKLAVMFQRLKAATQIPSNGRLYPTLLVGGYSLSKALCWGRRSSRGRDKATKKWSNCSKEEGGEDSELPLSYDWTWPATIACLISTQFASGSVKCWVLSGDTCVRALRFPLF